MPKKIDLSGSNNQNLTISLQELQAIVDRYKNERFNNIVPGHAKSDSRAVWLSRTALEEFLQKNSESTGLRLYFGVLDDLNHEDGAHNIIIVSTTTEGGDNVDRLEGSDTVIVTQTFDLAFIQASKAAHCPPPNRPCNGNLLSY